MAGISNAVDGGHGCARLTSTLTDTRHRHPYDDLTFRLHPPRIYVGDGRIVHYPGLSAFRPQWVGPGRCQLPSFALGTRARRASPAASLFT